MKNLKKRRLWTTNTYKRISLGGAHHKNELGKGVRTSGLLVGDDYANTALSGQCKHLLALGSLPAALAPGGAQQLNRSAQWPRIRCPCLLVHIWPVLPSTRDYLCWKFCVSDQRPQKQRGKLLFPSSSDGEELEIVGAIQVVIERGCKRVHSVVDFYHGIRQIGFRAHGRYLKGGASADNRDRFASSTANRSL